MVYKNWIREEWMIWLGKYFSAHKSDSLAQKIEADTGLLADWSDADWGTGARGEIIQ